MWGPNSRRQINATENKQELRHLGGFTARLLMPIAVNCLIMTRGGIRNGAFMAARSRVRSAPKPPTKHLNPSRVKNSFAASLRLSKASTSQSPKKKTSKWKKNGHKTLKFSPNRAESGSRGGPLLRPRPERESRRPPRPCSLVLSALLHRPESQRRSCYLSC